MPYPTTTTNITGADGTLLTFAADSQQWADTEPQVNAVVPWSGLALSLAFQSNIQTITLTPRQGVAVTGLGGTFTLGFNGVSTGALNAGAPPDVVAAALNALSSVIAVGGVTVAGFGYPYPYYIDFPNATGTVPAVTVATGSLLATWPSHAGSAGVMTSPGYSAPNSAVGDGAWNGPAIGSSLYLTAPGNGSNYATWTVKDPNGSALPSGQYQFGFEAWDSSIAAADPTHYGTFSPASQVTYRVYDGTSLSTAVLRAVVTMNQVGTNAQYVPFASALITSGQAIVVLADDVVPNGSGYSLWAAQIIAEPWSTTTLVYPNNTTAVTVPPGFAAGSVTVGSAVETVIGGPPTVNVTPSGGTASYGYTATSVVWSDSKAVGGDFDPGYGAQSYCLLNLPAIGCNVSGKINPGDLVTVAWYGATFTVAGGVAVPAAASLVCTNHSGVYGISTAVPVSRGMRIGWDAYFGDSFGTQCIYANAMKVGGNWLPVGGTSTLSMLAFDADGYANGGWATYTGAGGTSLRMVVTDTIADATAPNGYPLYKPGTWAVAWDDPQTTPGTGHGYASFWQPGSPTTGNTGATPNHLADNTSGNTTTAPTNNYVTADFPVNPGHTASPTVVVYVTGYVRNLRVYDPSITGAYAAPYGTVPKWHPSVTAEMAGVSVLRTLDSGQALVGATLASEYISPGCVSVGQALSQGGLTAAVTRLDPYPYSPTSNYSLQGPAGTTGVKVTCSGGHPFLTGSSPIFSGSGTIGGNIVVNLVAGSTGGVYGVNNTAFVLDSTSFVLPQNTADFFGETLSNVTATQPSSALPVSELVDFCNFHSLDMQWSLPVGLLPAELSTLAAYVAANLVGNLIIEMGDEHWNTNPNYSSAYYNMMANWPRLFYSTTTETRLVDGGGSPSSDLAYALDSVAKFAVVKAAYAAHAPGRPASARKLCLGGFVGSLGVTQAMIAYLKTHDNAGRLNTDPSFTTAAISDVSIVEIAPYTNVYPFFGIEGSTLSAMGPYRLADWADLYYGNLATVPALDFGHKAWLSTNAPGVELWAYEAGAGLFVPGTGSLSGSDLTTADTNSLAIGLFPQTAGWWISYLKALEAAGYSVAFIHQYNTGNTYEPPFHKNYGVYKGLAQVAGAGDGSDGKPNNLPAVVSAGVATTANLYTGATGSGVVPVSTAGYGISRYAAATLTGGGPTLVSVAVTPGTNSIVAGASVQLTATATYSDASTANVTATATWTTSNAGVATVSGTGLVMAVVAGTATITATYLGVAGTSAETVSAAPLVSVTISPSSPSVTSPGSVQLTATGHYSDGTTADLTSVSSWSSANGFIATVSGSGLVTGATSGTVAVTATDSGISGSVNVAVAAGPPVLTGVTFPATPTLAVAGTFQMHVTAVYSDFSTADVTSSATWSSSNPAIATVSASGLLTGVALGSCTLTVAYGGDQATTTINVRVATGGIRNTRRYRFHTPYTRHRRY